MTALLVLIAVIAVLGLGAARGTDSRTHHTGRQF